MTRTGRRAGAAAAGLAGAVALAACSGGPAAGHQPPARPGAVRPGAAGPGGPLRAARGFARVRAGRGPVAITVIGGHGSQSFILAGPGGPAGAFAVLPPGGPAGSSGRPHITVGPVPPAGSAPSALPLDSYEQVSVQQQQALAAAGDLLTQRCMAARGFSYPVAAQPGNGAATVQAVEDSGYGVASLSRAEAYGYRQAGQGGGVPLGIVIPGFLAEQGQHGPAWTSALLGIVPGARPGARHPPGCLQQADLELYGRLSGDPDPDPVPGIALQAAQWTQSDPRVQFAEQAWSACMARAGYRYRTPADAQQASWPSAPSAAEIATAVADVRCKAQVNFVNTWLAVEAAYQQALISQNLPELARLQAGFGRLLRRAEAALRRSVPVS